MPVWVRRRSTVGMMTKFCPKCGAVLGDDPDCYLYQCRYCGPVHPADALDEPSTDHECGEPCPPDYACDGCAGYWQRMREEGLWKNGKGWTDKALSQR
jgi:hypothetical protein